MASTKQVRNGQSKKQAKKEAEVPAEPPKRSLEDLSIEELQGLVKTLVRERDVARQAFARVVEATTKATAAANDADYLMRRTVDDYNAALQPKQQPQA